MQPFHPDICCGSVLMILRKLMKIRYRIRRYGLKKTAQCISSCIKPGQMLYRIVADEFVIVDFMVVLSMKPALCMYGSASSSSSLWKITTMKLYLQFPAAF